MIPSSSPPLQTAKAKRPLLRSSPAGDDANDRRHIPRVIRNAVDGAWERPPHAGYGRPCPSRWRSPTAGRATTTSCPRCAPSPTWATSSRRPARTRGPPFGASSSTRSTPFAAGSRRFPEAELFLSIDHGKFGERVRRVQKGLLRVEVATRGV
ncbi:hypothetical protein C2845_PM11G29100 [Panicum miliaceum]|uniref:Uncharacterized protein n=1 Tax=Panicum miliaceum TaxID=4540 RepID=A0A3L6RQ71_PANMI|nr:hypothetical protein C2845_PM11G29100 [Panicum miliaceum]